MKTTLLLKIMIAVLAVCMLPDSKADYYAAKNGQTPAGPYTSWSTAASNIQDAVNAAPTNGIVWVGAGRYTLPTNAVVYKGTNVVYIYKPLTLRSSNGVPDSTVIDGGGLYRGIAVDYYYDSPNRFLIDGFTISNCFVLNSGTNGGGGIIFNSGTYTGVVQNCVISDNTVTSELSGVRTDGGGGMFIQSRPAYSTLYYVISNCTFRSNRVLHNKNTGGGGGVYLITTSGGRMDNCLFESNSVVDGVGGGLLFFNTGVHNVRNCVISGNSQLYSAGYAGDAGYGGGGLSQQFSAGLTMWNCLVYNNYAVGAGGGVYNQRGSDGGLPFLMYNCTVVSNRSANAGGGITCRQGWLDRMELYNTIVCSNIDVLGTPDVRINTAAASVFTNNCVGNTNINGVSILNVGSGNITNSPSFVNFTGQNFRLNRDSPCVNRGLNQAWMDGARDLDGSPRVERFSGRVDMGCYENLPRGMMFKAR